MRAVSLSAPLLHPPRGLSHHDAQDALHDFFARVLRLGTFGEADPDKGRLRAFLCTALQRFLINRHEGTACQRQEVSIDSDRFSAGDEALFLKETFSEQDTPDQSLPAQMGPRPAAPRAPAARGRLRRAREG